MTSADKKPRSRAPLLQLCIFDDRRGDREGQETEKILGYYPSSTQPDSQTSFVGLAQASIAFASTFQPEQPCSILNTEHKRWILHPCEPHIYMLMIVEQEWHKGPIRESGLQALLKQLHQLLTLTHGPVEGLLEQDASGESARQASQEVLAEVGARLDKQRGLEYSRLHNPLSAFETVPLLRLPHQIFLSMQSLINRVLVSPFWCGAPLVGLMLMHESWMLSTTLCLAETNALYQLYSWTILPAIKLASQSSFGRKITRSNSVQQPGKRTSILQRSSWELSPDGFLLLSQQLPLKPTDGNEALQLPRLWLESREEWVSLLVLQVMDEIMMLILPESCSVASSVADNLVSVASPSMKVQSNQVSRHLQSIRRDHLPSFRYLFTDNRLMTTKASPGSKVATLSRNSLSLANAVRIDFEARQSDDEEGNLELAVWGHHDCWVVAKSQGRRGLYTVLEHHNKEGLTDACKAVDKFAQLHFEGLFD